MFKTVRLFRPSSLVMAIVMSTMVGCGGENFAAATDAITNAAASSSTGSTSSTSSTSTSSDSSSTTTTEDSNLKPEVEAGTDRSYESDSFVILGGTATDSDGTIVAYRWEQLSGEGVVLSDADQKIAYFTAPRMESETTLVFRFTATDDDGASASDLIQITVREYQDDEPENLAPTVEAGDDLSGSAGSTITLVGSATDSDGTIASVQWQQLSGSAVSLNSADTLTTTFTAPSVTVETVLQFQLTATDNDNASSTDTVSVTISPVEGDLPSVNAGADQSVTSGDSVILTGSASDTDGKIQTILWEQFSGTDVTLTASDLLSTGFTAPTVTDTTELGFRLTVTDNDGNTASDTVMVTVSALLGNSSPTVVATTDLATVSGEATVTLTASATDSDGSIATYAWSQTSGTNSVTLSATDAAEVSFTAPSVATSDTLTFEVTVTDNEGATAKADVSIQLQPALDSPTSLSVSRVRSGVLSATWNSVSGATGYNIYLASESGVTKDNYLTLDGGRQVEGVSKGVLLSGLTNGTRYYVVVTAVEGSGESAPSSEDSAVPFGQLNDTGIGFGGDATSGNSESCAGAVIAEQDCAHGRDATASDASDGRLGFSFVKIDAVGGELSAGAAEWSCVKDVTTGLMWEVKTDDYGVHDYRSGFSWYDSASGFGSENGGSCSDGNCDTEKFVDAVNAVGLCGATNWRLPTMIELLTLVDNSVTSSSGQATIDTDYFPMTNLTDYWTSSRYFDGSGSWLVNFGTGAATYGLTKQSLDVRLVRSVD